jgi:hypothetical protein
MITQTFEELLDSYLKARAAMEETEAAKKVVEEAILDKLREMKLTGTNVSGYNLQKVIRSSFTDVPMSVARELGCTEQIEKINSEKLRKLEANGVKVKGVKKLQYLLVREEKK